jgi:YVTN family beta-propeller protein
MSEQRTSGIATVMFTDVEASTDITTRLGDDAAASLLASHNTIVLDQVAAYGGRDVRSTGDGFLVVFDSARGAVSCALSIQRELTEREHAIRVRIGLNAGEVIEGGGELFGAAINLAARVMDRADGGEILTTDTVRQLVGTMTGASFRDRGRVALKGFAERQRLYEIRPADARLEPPPPPRRPPRRSRRTWAVLGAAMLAASIAGAVAIIHDFSSPDAISVPANSVAVIDPRARSVVDAIRVDENPGPVSAGAGGLWVLNLSSATLSRIDVRTRRLLETRGIGGAPTDRGTPGNVAASPDEVWVSAAGCNGPDPGALLHVFTAREGGIDLTGGDDVPLAEGVRAPGGTEEAGSSLLGCGVAARGTSAWVATNVPPGIARVDYDPVAGRSHTVWGRPLAGLTDAIAVSYGSVWAVDSQHEVIWKIDQKTGRKAVQLRAGADPVAIATDARAVWVANEGDNSVSRIDPRTNAVIQVIAVGKGPVAVATGGGAVWVAMSGDGSVARIDPRTNRVTATIAVSHRPQGIAVAGGLVWVTVRA